MRSMTGFGRAEATVCGLMMEIVVRSVNHKSLDIHFRLPRPLYSLESAMKERLQQVISRGRVEVSVQLRAGDMPLTQLKLDTARTDVVKNALDALVHRYDLQEPAGLKDILQVPDLWVEEPADLDENTLREGVLTALQTALRPFIAMREKEAEGLRMQLETNIAGMKDSIALLETRLPEIRKEARDKLKKRVEEYLRENPEWQEGRLQQELLFYLDKSDVQEEMTRLSSHIKQFLFLLDSKKPVGKKLDFLAQEMNREANTIASKSQDLTQTDAAIDLKVHIEQMREQIMNLE